MDARPLSEVDTSSSSRRFASRADQHIVEMVAVLPPHDTFRRVMYERDAVVPFRAPTDHPAQPRETGVARLRLQASQVPVAFVRRRVDRLAARRRHDRNGWSPEVQVRHPGGPCIADRPCDDGRRASLHATVREVLQNIRQRRRGDRDRLGRRAAQPAREGGLPEAQQQPAGGGPDNRGGLPG